MRKHVGNISHFFLTHLDKEEEIIESKGKRQGQNKKHKSRKMLKRKSIPFPHAFSQVAFTRVDKGMKFGNLLRGESPCLSFYDVSIYEKASGKARKVHTCGFLSLPPRIWEKSPRILEVKPHSPSPLFL